MIRLHPAIRPITAAAIVVAAVAWFVARPALYSPPQPPAPSLAELADAVSSVDGHFAAQWREAGLEPAAAADDLTVLRRLSLALVGSVPSLEEIRAFESDTGADRLPRWTARFIADRRFTEYFALVLAEAFIEIQEEDLATRPRLRFVEWLGESIQDGHPWDEMVREIIADRGVLADSPGAAVVAAEFAAGREAPERLAARTSRALLGQRIDCAQCHDHPFADWTQDQFEGLAAHYGQVRVRSAMIQDTRRGPFVVDDTRNDEKREVAPAVPSDPEWWPVDGNLRERLAAWATHPENRRIRRAIANRVWSLMFGRPIVTPVDDLPDPPDTGERDALDLLGDDLAAHGYDLRRLIHVIAASRPFRLASAHAGLDDPATAAILEKALAVFPVTGLDGHQMFRSMQQAASVRTIRPETESTFAQLRRFDARFRFVRAHGDETAEGEAKTSTVPEAVERLAGSTVGKLSRGTVWSAPGRIGVMASAAGGLEQAFLACLTRRPTPEEADFFLARPGEKANQRGRTAEDVYWTLFNSAEFCWNH